MGKAKVYIIIVIVVILIIIMSVYSFFKNTYNQLVILDEGVKTAWAQVENQLQRRYDLIPNLVETVKGYAAHEKETFIEVTNARARAAGANSPQEAMGANNVLASALGRLMVIVEMYPELKANQNFIRLQDELAGTENRLSVERRRYNETVRTYNQKIRSFPVNMIAGMFEFERANLFEVASEAKQAPKVKFE